MEICGGCEFPHAFLSLKECFFQDLLNAHILCMISMACIWTDIYPPFLCQYCFAHRYDGTTEPHHGATAKFEPNLKAATDDLFHYKRSCLLLLLFDCVKHDTNTWQPLREFCSSTGNLKDHLWLWNVFS